MTNDRLKKIIKHALIFHKHSDLDVFAEGVASEILLNCEIKAIAPKKKLGRRAESEKQPRAN